MYGLQTLTALESKGKNIIMTEKCHETKSKHEFTISLFLRIYDLKIVPITTFEHAKCIIHKLAVEQFRYNKIHPERLGINERVRGIYHINSIFHS